MRMWYPLILVAMVACGSMAGQQAGTSGGAAGTAVGPLVVNMSSIPQATEADEAAHPAIPPPQSGIVRPNCSDTRRGTPPSNPSPVPPGGPSPGGAPTATTPENAPAQPAVICAVGPAFILEAVDYSINVISTAGIVQAGFPKSLNALFGLPADANTGRASVVYDADNDRYVMAVAQTDSQGRALAMWLAVSRGGDPTQTWNIYRVQAQ